MHSSEGYIYMEPRAQTAAAGSLPIHSLGGGHCISEAPVGRGAVGLIFNVS